MKLFGIIYKITNKINGKIYIGQTTLSVEARWRSHKTAAKNEYKRGSTHIQRAIKKYGADSFLVETICSCFDKNTLDRMEQHFIRTLNTVTPNGYNLTSGGFCGNTQSDLTKERKRNSQIKRFQNLEERAKVTTGLMRFWQQRDPIELQQRSDKLKATWTNERRENVANLHVGNKYCLGQHYAAKPIILTNILTDEECEFPSAAEACKALNLDFTAISMCANNKRLTNRHWVASFADDISAHVEKIAKAKNSPNSKPPVRLKCVHEESKQEYIFNNATEAVNTLGLLYSEISTRLCGKRKGLHKGYRITPL